MLTALPNSHLLCLIAELSTLIKVLIAFDLPKIRCLLLGDGAALDHNLLTLLTRHIAHHSGSRLPLFTSVERFFLLIIGHRHLELEILLLILVGSAGFVEVCARMMKQRHLLLKALAF